MIWAIVPAGEDAEDPRRGFGTRDASTALLLPFLKETYDRDAHFVVEDELQRRSDYQDVRRFGTPVLSYGDEVLHVQSVGAFDEAGALEEFLNWSSTGHPLNAFITASRHLSAAPDGEIEPRALENAAEGIRSIVVGAYDSDGFLIWLPAPSPQ